MSGFAKTVGTVLAIYALSWFYTTWMVLIALFNFMRRGKTYLEVKPRTTPPACLNDPAYGRHNFVKLKDVKLHYVEAGDNTKPMMLFLHGFPEFWYSWRHQIKEFKNDYWTVAVDLRGYGDSDKPSGKKHYTAEKIINDIVQLVEALGRSSCVVVAHDWGGVLAYGLAAKCPKMVDRLIIMNAPHPEVIANYMRSNIRQFFMSWYIFFFQMPFIPEILVRLGDLEFFDKLFLKHPRGREVFCDHDIEAYKYAFANSGDFTGPINYYRHFVSNATKKMEKLPRITVPSLIIWGTDDTALRTDVATLSSQKIDNCVIKLVKGASHWVQQDSPSAVNQHMRTFLQEYRRSLLVATKVSGESLVGRMRDQIFSYSASKLTKVPGVTPVISLYQANSWVAGINRKLL